MQIQITNTVIILHSYPRLYLSLNPVVIVGDELLLITFIPQLKPYPPVISSTSKHTKVQKGNKQ